jgi:hypothetical protein
MSCQIRIVSCEKHGEHDETDAVRDTWLERALEQRFSKLGSAELGVPRNENAQWSKSFIGGPKFVCTNYISCGDIRH